MQLKYKPTDSISLRTQISFSDTQKVILKTVTSNIESRMLLSMVKRSFPRKCDTNSIVHFNYKTSFLLDLI